MTKPAQSLAFSGRWTYDVFLSFRGEDTRTGFTGNLYNALCQRGIRAFIDDVELSRGEEITPSLFIAIKESRIAIIIFSKNYASSTFCLDELVHILEYLKGEGRLVWPVFYDVDPSHVRHHKGSYGEALARHEERFKDSKDKVQKWRLALSQAANLSGWQLKHGKEYEYEFIGRITKEISTKIDRTLLHVTDYPVGLESRVLEVNSLLDVQSNSGVNMVGIYGIGGIGKTTIARAVYNLIGDQFEGLCFLSNVREVSDKHGLTHLQETLFADILGDKEIKLGDVNRGISMIKHRLCQKRVLLILDDVDKLEQLQAIAGRCDWFGCGSRIIITTRDKHLLTSHGVERIYVVKELNDEEAVQLFSWKAFRKDEAHSSHLRISRHVVDYCSGLPLALEVIGSNFCGRRIDEWISALHEYERIPDSKIFKALRLTYDALEENEKEIFLDVACFLKGDRLEHVKDRLLSVRDIKSEYALQVLIDKSLIKDEYGYVTMHDLIQDMGREIIRQESPKEPGGRSRLWFYQDILHVLEENTGTDKIEVIILDNLPDGREIKWSGKAFKKMKNLRMLLIGDACFSRGPRHLPNSLRVLKWRHYPWKFLPSDFHPPNLFSLDLYSSSCVLLKPLTKRLDCLRDMSLSNCIFLRQVPDLSGAPNLQKLYLNNCQSLTEIHDSVGFLDKLRVLNAERCPNLKTFPRRIKLPFLERLELSWCSSLRCFPEVLEKMENITELSLQGTAIEELPYSICNLPNLQELCLDYCPSLIDVHDSVGFLGKLRVLSAERCTNLKNLPRCIELPFLKCLRLSWCPSLQCFPEVLGKMGGITKLSLLGTGIEELPYSICNLTGLERLDLRECGRIKQLPTSVRLLPKLWFLQANSCAELRYFTKCEAEEVEGVRSTLSIIDYSKCNLSNDSVKLCLSYFPNLTHLDLSFNSFTILPACTEKCSLLRNLCVEYCEQLRLVEGMPPNLETFNAGNCTSLTSLSSSKLLNQAFNGPRRRRDFIFPGQEVPKWFDSYSNGESTCFWVRKEVPAIAVCVVVGVLDSTDGLSINITLSMHIDGIDHRFYCNQVLASTMTTHHICLFDSRHPYGEIEELLEQDEWYQVEVLCESNPWLGLKGGVIKCCGVHVYKQENNMENIQFSRPSSPKRTCNDLYNSQSDMKPGCCSPLIKRQRTTLDMGVCDCESLDIQHQWGLALAPAGCETVSEQNGKKL